MKTLLVSENVEDSEILIKIIKAKFRDIEVIHVSRQDHALEAASSDGPFGFFIIDAEIRKNNPSILAANLIELTGDRPIIFLGNEAIINDRIQQEIYQANIYNEKLLKPLERDGIVDDLANKIDRALEFAKEEEFEQSLKDVDPNDYIPMKLRSFYLFNSFPYDIYLAITNTRYIKIISANKPYTISILTVYARKNIRFLHIKKDDQLKYLEEETKQCIRSLKKGVPNSKENVVFLLRSITILQQYILALGLSPSVTVLADTIVESVIKVDLSSRLLSDILKSYPSEYSGISSKSLMTGLIALALSKNLGWDSVTTKSKLIMASVLQDITLTDDSLTQISELGDEALNGQTELNIAEFVAHPTKAAELAIQFTKYPDLDFLIKNHHELPNKMGFPNKPSSLSLTVLCSVFNISQHIAAKLDDNDITNELIDSLLKSMLRNFNAANFKEPMKIAKKIMKV